METEEREYSKFQWFIMVIFIPTMFAIILFVVVMHFIGINVIDQTKQFAASVPLLSNFVTTEEEIAEEEERMKIGDLMETISSKERDVQNLENQLAMYKKEIDLLEAKVDQLNQQLEEKDNLEQGIRVEYEEIARLYESMSAKNAANIINELPTEQAAEQLMYVKTSTRADILARLSPEKSSRSDKSH